MDHSPSFSFQAGYEHPGQHEDDADTKSVASKSSKRKRLAKACNACHRAKRRCDGTAPCSNCYFASKPCEYTDASGRPVPPPHSGQPDGSKAPRSSSARSRSYGEETQSLPSTSHVLLDTETMQSRKRVKSEQHSPEPAAPVLDHGLTRELTNLFFTHCHPVRDVIHRPSFATALSHRHVPSYLLYAICALAAPLSRQPRLRTSPPRLAGKPFAREAASLMFDGSGRLLCGADLFTAQALCLLAAHDHVINAPGKSRYRDLALQIVQTLGLHDSDPALPVPTAERIQASIERESVRRIFWVGIHLMDLHFSVYAHTPPPPLSDAQTRLRLPADETSFELQVQSTLPEYLYLPRASELGHLIRIMTVFAQIEQLGDRSSPEAFAELERRGEEWVSNLPDHLRFSESNLQVQKSMFETSSNTGAWCFCCMHVYHASFALALHAGRNLFKSSPKPRPQWAVTRLDMIMNMLGDRAKNTWMLVGTVLWTQVKYCHQDDDRIREWCNEHEELWGTRILDSAAYRSLSSGPISPTYSMGRSLDELRLHNPRSDWSNAGLAGSSGDGMNRRKGAESLPSLKSSGLLDWKSEPTTSMPVGLQWLAKEPR
ncbi:fungal-specific transcription factor domain-containing protein [Roridomyces roridus]|uniref:Fungal-specific transcription factor domain-containing protein n=1 Tax=Roridomyces roridus TaxID=1738132 RepID=A0AAD7BK21_9AGAR|nr:fungal-specific transcription factor domain-containing protein [Roridomyces roridus]